MKLIGISSTGRAGAVRQAAECIREGGIVAFPTETFYGLGVAYDNISALERLFGLKRRPEDKPLPLVIGDLTTLGLVASSVNDLAAEIIKKFWPGPLTILLPAREGLPHFLTAGIGKVAVRMPGESFALELACSTGFPLTATSANISGMPPADNPEGVMGYFGDSLDLLIDGGRTPGGKPSTIVEISGKTIVPVRAGVISFEEVLQAAAASDETQ